MGKIALTKNKYALVDDDLVDSLNQWKWRIGGHGYATRALPKQERVNGKQGNIFMHRVIDETPTGQYIDHINHNKLDNRKENLRRVTYSQNCMNKSLQSNNTTGYRGIHWNKKLSKWQVTICIMRKNIYLGIYEDLETAKKVRRDAEEMYFKEFTYRAS